MPIGDRIKKIRTDKGNLSQKEFALKIGTAASTVQRYEQVNAHPKGDILQRIHDVFGVSIDWLLTGKGAPYEEPQYAQPPRKEFATHEGTGLYGRTRMHEVEGRRFAVTEFGAGEQSAEPSDANARIEKEEETVSLGSAVEILAELLSSKNEEVLHAVIANLRAFKNLVRLEGEKNSIAFEMTLLRTEIASLRKEVETLRMERDEFKIKQEKLEYIERQMERIIKIFLEEARPTPEEHRSFFRKLGEVIDGDRLLREAKKPPHSP